MFQAMRQDQSQREWMGSHMDWQQLGTIVDCYQYIPTYECVQGDLPKHKHKKNCERKSNNDEY